MNLATWAERNGVARVTAYRWFRAGLLPVPARKVGRLILVDDPLGKTRFGSEYVQGALAAQGRELVVVDSSMAIAAAVIQAVLIANDPDGHLARPVALPQRMNPSTRACTRCRASNRWACPPAVAVASGWVE